MLYEIHVNKTGDSPGVGDEMSKPRGPRTQVQFPRRLAQDACEQNATETVDYMWSECCRTSAADAGEEEENTARGRENGGDESAAPDSGKRGQ